MVQVNPLTAIPAGPPKGAHLVGETYFVVILFELSTRLLGI